MVRLCSTSYLKKISAYQVLKFNEDDPSVGTEDLLKVTAALTAGEGQQESHHDAAEHRPVHTLERRQMCFSGLIFG